MDGVAVPRAARVSILEEPVAGATFVRGLATVFRHLDVKRRRVANDADVREVVRSEDTGGGGRPVLVAGLVRSAALGGRDVRARGADRPRGRVVVAVRAALDGREVRVLGGAEELDGRALRGEEGDREHELRDAHRERVEAVGVEDAGKVDGVDVGGVAGEDDEAFETGAPRAEEADDTKPPPREEVAEVAVAEPPAAESEPVVEDIAADAADAAAEPEPEPEPVVATATEEEPEAPAGGKKKRGGKKGKKGKR